MPRPKLTRTTRTCQVCGGTTTIAHLGLDVCRACTVFYRRSRERKFICRSNTNKCPIIEGVNCRKCRLSKMTRMLAEQSQWNLARAQRLDTSHNNEAEEEEGDQNRDINRCNDRQSAACSPQFPSVSEPPKSRELLEKLRDSYRAMCDARLAGELAARDDPPHPIDVAQGKYEILPVTYKSIHHSYRLFLITLMQFGSRAFPEFAKLESKQKWSIVTNFSSRYRMFEGNYRSDEAFGDDLTKSFAGCTMYWGIDIADHFFDDCPKERTYIAEAKKVMQQRRLAQRHTECRVYTRRARLRHDEFLAVLATMFWSIDDLEISEEVARIGQSYKEKIMRELHDYYRRNQSISASTWK